MINNVEIQERSISQLIMAGLIGGGLAAVANLLIWLIANWSLGSLDVMPPPPNPPEIAPVPWFVVIFASLISGVLAGALLWVFARFSAMGVRLFQVVAVLILLASFISPFDAAQSTRIAVALSVMHVAAAALILWALMVRKV